MIQPQHRTILELTLMDTRNHDHRIAGSRQGYGFPAQPLRFVPNAAIPDQPHMCITDRLPEFNTQFDRCPFHKIESVHSGGITALLPRIHDQLVVEP